MLTYRMDIVHGNMYPQQPTQLTSQPQGIPQPQAPSFPQSTLISQQSPVQKTTQPTTPENQLNTYLEDQLKTHYEPEQTFMKWESSNRPYKKHDKEFYTTIAVIVFLLSIILFFAGQFLLIAVILAITFVSYVLAAVPPEKAQHAITTFGIRTESTLYHWNQLGRFWYTESFGEKLLHIEYLHRYLTRITLLIGNIKEEELTAILLQYLPHQTPIPTFIEKVSHWLQEKIPLEKSS